MWSHQNFHTPVPAKVEIKNDKCEHMNEDGTFKGGFDGCVLHMKSCGGHSDESARAICGKIAQEKAG